MAHVWRFLWDTARQYRESIDVYGSKKSFEWQLITDDSPVLHTAKKPEPEIAERVEVPDYAHLLPEPICKFTRRVADEDHLSFIQGGGHGGSHPHWSTSSCPLSLKIAIHFQTRNSRRTGPASGSAPISRRSKAGRS